MSYASDLVALRRRARLRREYGITPEQYDLMLRLQKGVCAICLRPPKVARLNVDHDHKTGRVRGLLCWWCNRKLLMYRNTAEMMERAIPYLRSSFDGRALVVDVVSSNGVKPSFTIRSARSKRS